MSNELISFRFQIGEPPYQYSDALVMTQDAYDALTPEQIATLQQERYDRWYEIVTAPPESQPEEVPTEENA